MSRGAAAPARPRPEGSPKRLADLAARPVPSPEIDTRKAARPRRGRAVADRLAQQEARLLAAVVACTTVVCGLLIVYLAAYAQVASLGIQLSKARVELRKEKLDGETLRAQVARAASPERISAAAAENGMVLQHSPKICYVNPTDDSGITSRPGMGDRTADSAADATQGSGLDNAGQSGNNSGPRMASRGTITDNLTTASVAN